MIALPNWKISKEDREKLILAVLLAGIVLVGGYFALLSGAWTRLGRDRRERDALKEKIEEASAMIADSSKIQRVSTDISSRMQGITGLVPEETDSSWILHQVGDVEKSQRVSTVAIKPLKDDDAAEQQSGYYKTALCQIELKTDYHSLGRFVDQLERKNPYLRIKDMTVEQSPDDPVHHQVAFKVQYFVSRASLRKKP